MSATTENTVIFCNRWNYFEPDLWVLDDTIFFFHLGIFHILLDNRERLELHSCMLVHQVEFFDRKRFGTEAGMHSCGWVSAMEVQITPNQPLIWNQIILNTIILWASLKQLVDIPGQSGRGEKGAHREKRQSLIQTLLPDEEYSSGIWNQI